MQILPVFIVKIIARKYCEKLPYAGGKFYVRTAFTDVFIKDKQDG